MSAGWGLFPTITSLKLESTETEIAHQCVVCHLSSQGWTSTRTQPGTLGSPWFVTGQKAQSPSLGAVKASLGNRFTGSDPVCNSRETPVLTSHFFPQLESLSPHQEQGVGRVDTDNINPPSCSCQCFSSLCVCPATVNPY